MNAYDEIEEIANAQGRVIQTGIQKELDLQYGEGIFDWSEIREQTTQLLRDLFRGAAKSIGQWPNSSAYYSVDVIYDLHDHNESQSPSIEPSTVKNKVHPRLIEVNFMGDWHGAEGAVSGDTDMYHQWATDLLTVLSLPEDQLPTSRLTKL